MGSEDVRSFCFLHPDRLSSGVIVMSSGPISRTESSIFRVSRSSAATASVPAGGLKVPSISCCAMSSLSIR